MSRPVMASIHDVEIRSDIRARQVRTGDTLLVCVRLQGFSTPTDVDSNVAKGCGVWLPNAENWPGLEDGRLTLQAR